MANVITNTRKVISDVLAFEFNRTYNYASAKVKNNAVGAITIDNPIGQPVGLAAGVYGFLAAGAEADTLGIIVHGDPVQALAAAALTPTKFLILVRGPAGVRPSGIAATDAAGAAFTKATIVTALAALSPPIITVDEAPEATFTSP